MAQPSTTDTISTSGLTITLHPLPILNISEHYTRTRLQQHSDHYKIIGALLGIQKGTSIEIVNSYELAFAKPAPTPSEATDGASSSMQVDDASPGGTGFGGEKVDWTFYEERSGNFKQVLPTLDFVGWYSIGSTISPLDLSLHKQFTSQTDSPLFLQFSPPTAGTSDASAKASQESDLPLAVYETVGILDTATDVKGDAHMEVDGGGVKLKQARWKIETGEAERIAVEGVGKAGLEGGKGESSLIPNLTTQRNALQMLSNRTQILLDYLKGVSAGTLKRDPEVLRMISGLMAGLPVEEGDAFRDEFMTEYADVQLTAYLSTLTKTLHSLNNVTDKFTLLHAPSAGDRGAGFDPSAGGMMGMGMGMGGMDPRGGRSGNGRKLGGSNSRSRD